MGWRGGQLKRKRASLQVRPRILIFCGGEVTEPEYIDELRKRERINLIEIIVDKRAGQPKTLVDRAVEEKKRAMRNPYGKYDEVWCVFDTDEHPNIPDAIQKANAHGVKLAISNPNFELWLLLHFEYRSAYLTRQDARRECERFMNGYAKHIPADVILPLVNTALGNARRLAAWHETRGSMGQNPCTAVHILIERLLASRKEELLKQIVKR